MSERTKLEWALADALAVCPSFATPEKRADLLHDLDTTIRAGIAQHTAARDACLSIVRNCADYPGGIDQLRNLVAYREGKKPVYWEPVLAAFQALTQKIDDDRKVAVADRAGRGGEVTVEKKYALVIGISEYDHGTTNQILQPKQFSNLLHAADDAKAFHQVLVEDGNYDIEPPMLDSRARQRDILHAIDTLRKKCRLGGEKNPIVVVFFSGHGATDADGRNYLVPYDAERNDLFATALWSKTLDSVLAELDTNRLVVFLDACHSGAMATEGTKDAGVLQYNPASLVETQDKRCRHVVASCAADQQSKEGEGSGIFTRHLVDLLRCSRPEDFDSETIDLWDIYLVLKRKVVATARELFGVVQVPYANLERPTGIVMAINRGLRQARLEREQSFLNAVVDELARTGEPQRGPIRSKLEQYLDNVNYRAELDNFYTVFSARARQWTPGDTELVEESCRDLVYEYGKRSGRVQRLGYVAVPSSPEPAMRAAPRATPGASSVPERAPNQSDQYTPGAPSASPAATGVSIADLPRPALVQRLSRAERRRFTLHDCEYVREPIWDPLYLEVAGELNDLLSLPAGVSEDEIRSWVLQTKPADPAAQLRWKDAAHLVWSRFQERWEQAEPETAKPQSALNIRTAAGNA